MKIEMKTLRNIFIGVAICIFLYWLLHATERVSAIYGVLRGIVSPFVTGAALAFVANVPMRAIEGLLKPVKQPILRRLIAVVLTFLVVLLVLSLVFWLLIPQLITTVQSLIPKLHAFFINLETTLLDFLEQNPNLMKWVVENTDLENINWAGLVQNAVGMFGDSVSTILSSTFNAIGGITSALMDFVIALVFALYCLFQKETLARQGRKLLYAFLPERIADNTIRIMRLSNSTFSNFLSGQCVEVCILGCLFAVAMAILRMPFIPLVSVLVAVTAFIPVVGAWTGCVLGAFFILVNDPMQAVWFVIMFVVLQQIENNMIYPRVVGTSIGLSGMWVLLAVAVGGEVMGVAGMFLMIPVASVLYTLLREMTNQRLAGKVIDPAKLTEQPPELVSHFKQKRESVKRKRKLRKNTNTSSDDQSNDN